MPEIYDNTTNVSIYDESGVRQGTTTNPFCIDIEADSIGISKESTQLRRYGGGKTAVCATITASGNTTVYTPTAGKAIRLYWVSAQNDPASLLSPLIKISIGSTEYYRAFATSHWEVFTGAVNAALVVNMSSGGNVAFTAHFEEV